MMGNMNGEFRKIVKRVKSTQGQLQSKLKESVWLDDARKFADKQRREVKKLLTDDVGKVKKFIQKERKELEKFQKQIPGEVKKFKKFVDGQKKELEKLLTSLRKMKVPSSKKKSKSRAKTKSKVAEISQKLAPASPTSETSA